MSRRDRDEAVGPATGVQYALGTCRCSAPARGALLCLMGISHRRDVQLQRPSLPPISEGSDMLQELTHMDRITQLQDEIQQVRQLLAHSRPRSSEVGVGDKVVVLTRCSPQLLTIMSNTIAYLTSRANFAQVSPDVPVTKQRKADKFDPPEVLEGGPCVTRCHVARTHLSTGCSQQTRACE